MKKQVVIMAGMVGCFMAVWLTINWFVTYTPDINITQDQIDTNHKQYEIEADRVIPKEKCKRLLKKDKNKWKKRVEIREEELKQMESVLNSKQDHVSKNTQKSTKREKLVSYISFLNLQTVLAYELSDKHGYIESPECMRDMVEIRKKYVSPHSQNLRNIKIAGENRMAVMHVRSAYSYLIHCWSCTMEDRDRWCKEASWEAAQAMAYLTGVESLLSNNYINDLKSMSENIK